MQRKGTTAGPSNPPVQVPATDDEIREKYLERAIRELNQLTRAAQECEHCPRGNLMPVLGSGHPQADVFMLKFAPRPSEIEEGVAFYGRAGSALMKSFKRLGIDPLAVYGTVFVKCPVPDTDMSAPECRARVLDELAVVQPRIVVVMGEEALEELNGLGVPLGAQVEADPGGSRSSPPAATPCTCPTSTPRWTTSPPSASSGARSGRWATGTPTFRLTERRRAASAAGRAPPRTGSSRSGPCAAPTGARSARTTPSGRRPGGSCGRPPRCGR